MIEAVLSAHGYVGYRQDHIKEELQKQHDDICADEHGGRVVDAEFLVERLVYLGFVFLLAHTISVSSEGSDW